MRGTLTRQLLPTVVTIAFGLATSTGFGRRILARKRMSTRVAEAASVCTPRGCNRMKVWQSAHGKSRSPQLTAAGAHSSRALLQSIQVVLQVNVTFPKPLQQANSVQTAKAFREALQINSSSILHKFEDAWGNVQVSNAILTFVNDDPLPPPDSTLAASQGSIGALIGISIAALIMCTFVAGTIKSSKAIFGHFIETPSPLRRT